MSHAGPYQTAISAILTRIISKQMGGPGGAKDLAEAVLFLEQAAVYAASRNGQNGLSAAVEIVPLGELN